MMKRLKFIGLVALLVLFSACRTTPTKVVFESPDQVRKISNVAVLPFVCNRSKTGVALADALADNLKDSRFEVVETERLRKMLASQRLSLKRVAENHNLAVGKLKDVDALIVGNASVRAFRGYTEHVAETTARMIETATGEVLLEVRFSASDISRFSMQGTVPADEIGKALAQKFAAY